jgi:hypothetical protein
MASTRTRAATIVREAIHVAVNLIKGMPRGRRSLLSRDDSIACRRFSLVGFSVASLLEFLFSLCSSVCSVVNRNPGRVTDSSITSSYRSYLGPWISGRDVYCFLFSTPRLKRALTSSSLVTDFFLTSRENIFGLSEIAVCFNAARAWHTPSLSPRASDWRPKTEDGPQEAAMVDGFS